MKVVGLMSGTSMDGIDAALIEIEELRPRGDGPGGVGSASGPAAASGGARPGWMEGDGVAWRLVTFETFPFPRRHRGEIHDCMTSGRPESMTRLHARLGEWFAEAVLGVCRTAGIGLPELDLIGSHGQTVWHQPPQEAGRGATLQLGCPATIAERTGVDVVSDFRSRDMAAGGEGAPLVPWVDRLLFAGDRVRILQNIGGMGNLTRVPPRGTTGEPIVAFDTGPGNAVIDGVMELATDGDHTYDPDGAWARRGTVDAVLLDALLRDPFFDRPPPKSTGRESFGRAYVEALVERVAPDGREAWEDLVATVTALTARSIGEAIRRWAPPGPRGEMIVTGGGAENPALMELLGRELAPTPVLHGDVLGFDPEAKEAVAFAVLAWAHVTGRPGNIPSVTGASGPRVLGSLTPGRTRHG